MWSLENAELRKGYKLKFMAFSVCRSNREIVRQLSTPTPGSSDLHFPTRFSRNGWGQFKSCLWKQNLSYWRSPSYNLNRIIHTCVSSFCYGILFWNQGKKLWVLIFLLPLVYVPLYAIKTTYFAHPCCLCFFLDVRDNQQNLFNILGCMFSATIFLGINNCSTVLPHIATERTVMYRERFAGMYSARAYALAQVLFFFRNFRVQCDKTETLECNVTKVSNYRVKLALSAIETS